MGDAVWRWADQLRGWAVPDEIARHAPEPPWGFLPGMFEVAGEADAVDVPSRHMALEALGAGGSVLDVGCGGGSASLALLPAVTLIVGVDQRLEAIDQLLRAAAGREVPCRGVAGRWPDIAATVAPADVVVCHHVFYNVQDVEPFVEQLNRHAYRRVVVELNRSHPLTYLRPLWQRFWGLERPPGPTAEDAVAVIRELGIEPLIERGHRPPGHWRSVEQQVHLARKRLCLPASRDEEIASALASLPSPSTEVWCLAWLGAARW